jgi:hypothetical protein
MKKFFVPTIRLEDWQKLLAEPNKHWRTGYSARALASCWESANGAFPLEIQKLFNSSNEQELRELEILMAFPEWKVLLPPSSGHPSQNDLFILARDIKGDLISIMIEGKVLEPFGAPLSEWFKDETSGKRIRLSFIQSKLGLVDVIPGSIRYQLLHRTVSAIIEAERFRAKRAVMLVHSFSQEDRWFDDYACFLRLYGVIDAQPGVLYALSKCQNLNLYSGWARGDPNFLTV